MDRELVVPTPRGASVNLPDAKHTEVGRRFQALLERISPLDCAAWESILAQTTLADLAEALRFSPEGYARVRIAETDDAEILVLGWLPGQGSPVHGHGESHGLVHVVCGEAGEERYRLFEGVPVPDGERIARAGEVLRETPEVHHRVWNAGTDLLVTLHLYSPKLAR